MSIRYFTYIKTCFSRCDWPCSESRKTREDDVKNLFCL